MTDELQFEIEHWKERAERAEKRLIERDIQWCPDCKKLVRLTTQPRGNNERT